MDFFFSPVKFVAIFVPLDRVESFIRLPIFAFVQIIIANEVSSVAHHRISGHFHATYGDGSAERWKSGKRFWLHFIDFLGPFKMLFGTHIFWTKTLFFWKQQKRRDVSKYLWKWTNNGRKDVRKWTEIDKKRTKNELKVSSIAIFTKSLHISGNLSPPKEDEER